MDSFYRIIKVQISGGLPTDYNGNYPYSFKNLFLRVCTCRLTDDWKGSVSTGSKLCQCAAVASDLTASKETSMCCSKMYVSLIVPFWSATLPGQSTQITLLTGV